MKLKINRFKELANKEISLPQAIVSGANGAGKTSILEAFYFVVDGKKSDGSSVSGEIYSQYAKSKSELIVEVELEINDTTKFCRRCEGSEKRAKGSPISELVRNINTTLFIEKDGKRDIVTQKDWNEQISAYFPENWRYLTNPNFLQTQKQADVKDFVFGLLNLSEFDTKNKDIAKSKVTEKKQEIANLDILIREYEKAIGPMEVEDLTEYFNTQISELRAKINVPTLSGKDVLYNSKIQKQIAEIEVLKPKTKELKPILDYPTLNEKSYIPLQSTHLLESEIEKIRSSVIDKFHLTKINISEAKNRNALKKELQNKIENYDKIKEGLKCTICPVCTDLFCEKRSVDIESLASLQEQNESIDFVNIEALETQIEAEKIEFETSKKNHIAGLEAELQEIQRANEKIKSQNAKIAVENELFVREHNAKAENIRKQNEQIMLENEAILCENAKINADFEKEKAAKLAELRALIKYPAKVDNSEVEAEISKLETLKENNRQDFLSYTKLLAVYNNAQKEIARLHEKKTALQEDRADLEQAFIIEINKEQSYYLAVENRINSKLSEFGVKFKFYKHKILDNDLKADFRIILNDRIFNSNGEGFIQKVVLCNFFQKTKGVVLPIFCDEVAILDEYNIEKLLGIFVTQKNIVLLEKTAKELTIINF